MPEGVEVKISAELIRPLVEGKKIISVDTHPSSRYAVVDPDGFKGFKNSLSKTNPVNIIKVSTKGKLMYWTFSNEYYMTCAFGMTGQWSPIKGKHPCIIVKYIDNDEDKLIYFNDPRHFGNIAFYNSFTQLNAKISSLGWDPLQDSLDTIKTETTTKTGWLPYLTKTIRASKKPIGQLLMDQSIFAGVGNYIRAEALYLSKLSPWRAGNMMTADEIKGLCESIIAVMNESYKYQGATILTYKDAYGNEGKYSSVFKVYNQKLDPLGNKIIKEDTPDKRTIHWCPTIQR